MLKILALRFSINFFPLFLVLATYYASRWYLYYTRALEGDWMLYSFPEEDFMLTFITYLISR